MIKSKKQGSMIIISGTTCAGKGTVIKELLKRNKNLKLSISYTSRDIRPGDVVGSTYHFVSKEEFESKIANGDFLEYALVHGNYYGTPKGEIIKMLDEGYDVILEIDVEGAKKIKKMFPSTILIFIMAPSMEVVKERIKNRNSESTEQILQRFKTAYQEINEVYNYNYVVVNDILEDAVLKVESILISEKCRVDRIEDVYLNNKEEMIHELLIDKEFNNE